MDDKSQYLQTIEKMLSDLEGKEIIFKDYVQEDTIFVNQPVYNMSSKKLNGLKKIAEIQKYYQCNPVRFVSDFFGIELFDAQAWVLQAAWTKPFVMCTASRSIGKSSLIAIYLMARGMLMCNNWAYICSGTGSQAQQTFITLERLANDNVDEMVGSYAAQTFKPELVVPNAAGDGFSHSADGYRYQLFNGSTTRTLNSNVDSNRGRSLYFDIY